MGPSGSIPWGGDSTLSLLADLADTGGLLSHSDSLECAGPDGYVLSLKP